MIEVENQLRIFEINGKDMSYPWPKLQVRQHRLKSRVVLEVEGKTYVLSADDLRRAIENATNTGSLV
jgi:hypothetical protein